MKKNRLFLLLFAFLAFAPMAWAQLPVNISSEYSLRLALADGSSYYVNATYRLTDDITLHNGELTISYNPTIDLNGHTLSAGGHSRLFNVNQGTQLTITDNSDNHDGVLIGGSADNGGAIYNAGTLVIQNGTISNNTASNQGGAIYNAGTLVIQNGTISNNDASNQGGAIYNASTLVIENGTISSNIASDQGGAIYNIGTITLSGGTIISNTAANGGAIHLTGGSLTMTGGSINGNSSTGNCGGVNLTNGGNMTMSGGSIANNTSGNNDGGIYVGSGSTLTMTGGSVTGNTSTHAGRGGGISVNGTLVMSGNPQVSGNTANGNSKNVYLPSEKTITVNGEFSSGANVSVTLGNWQAIFTSGYSDHNTTAPANVFHSDMNNYAAALKDGEATIYPCQWTSGATTCAIDYATGIFTVSGNGAMANYSDSNNVPWNDYDSYIQSLVVENGVTTIGARTFAGCNQLESLSIGDNVTTIGQNAFSMCSGLKTLHTNNVQTIGEYAFWSFNLETVIFGSSLRTIADNAFWSNEFINIYSYVDPANLTWNQAQNGFDGVFFTSQENVPFHVMPGMAKAYKDKFHYLQPGELGSTYVNRVIFTDDMYQEWTSGSTTCRLWLETYIFEVTGNGPMANYNLYYPTAPWKNKQIKAIHIGEGVTSVGDWAFYQVNSLLTEVTFPETGLTSIGTDAFYDCDNLTSITIPEGVTVIKEQAFNSCGALSTVLLPHSLTRLETSAFAYCTSLTTLTIPESVTEIGLLAFGNCIGVTDVNCYAAPQSLNWPYRDDDFKPNKATRFHVPSGTLATYQSKFGNANVTFVGDLSIAHEWISGSTTCTLADDGTFTVAPTNGNSGAMADYTVDNMPEWYSWKFHITNLIVNDGVTKIGDYAFYQAANLADITLGQNLNAIGNDAFSGCTDLESIYIEAVNPPALGVYNPFNQVPENIPVYVPCNTLADYQAAEGWNAFTNLIDPCATVTQTIELSQGWNWVSIYIEGEPEELLDMLKTGLGDNALSIEGTEGVIEYIGDGYSFGDEFGIANETMYLIDVVTACTVELQGLPANPSDHEIEINPNDWNWIGYPCNEELLVEVALSGYEPEIGDIIESNTDGVVEYVGVWYGDFDTLKPGRGYMYYSASGESKTLVFQTERSKAKAKSGFFSGKTSKMSIERKVESWD